MVLPRRRPHANAGRMNGRDAEVADSRARGDEREELVQGKYGHVAEAHSKVAVTGKSRGGWALVTA